MSDKLTSLRIVMGPAQLPKSDAGNAELPTKNRHFAYNKQGRKYVTKRGKAFRKALADHLGLSPNACTEKARAVRVEQAKKKGLYQCEGRWSIDVRAYTRRRGGKCKDLVDQADCDSDACLTPAKDALEAVGVLDNDARIVKNYSESEYLGESRIVIELRRLE